MPYLFTIAKAIVHKSLTEADPCKEFSLLDRQSPEGVRAADSADNRLA